MSTDREVFQRVRDSIATLGLYRGDYWEGAGGKLYPEDIVFDTLEDRRPPVGTQCCLIGYFILYSQNVDQYWRTRGLLSTYSGIPRQLEDDPYCFMPSVALWADGVHSESPDLRTARVLRFIDVIMRDHLD